MLHSLRLSVFAAVFCTSAAVTANTITDVGIGPAPNFDPNQGTTWTLSSHCTDINEAGEAACQARAVGPTYRCGFRGAQRCSSKVYHVYKWDGFNLTRMSNPAAEQDFPLIINNHGEIGGYSYRGAIYPRGGGNGFIWRTPEVPENYPTVVTWLNDKGAYILQTATASGGVLNYGSSAHGADGTSMSFPGSTVRPFVIGNNGHVIGAQIIQTFVQDIFSPTGDEIPEVSGVGWLLTQSEIDALERNEAGLYDNRRRRPLAWPLLSAHRLH